MLKNGYNSVFIYALRSGNYELKGLVEAVKA